MLTRLSTRLQRIYWFKVSRNLSFSNVNGVQALEVGCNNCKVSIRAEGGSVLNYYDHSQAVRSVTKTDFGAFNTFKPSQVIFRPNASGLKRLPCSLQKNSHHLFCGCEKQTYLGCDLSHSTGTIAVCIDNIRSNLPASYQPNHHLHYSERKADVSSDQLPKWKTIVGSELIAAVSSHHADKSPQFGWNHASQGTAYDAATGKVKKDVFPLSPLDHPVPEVYTHSEQEIPINHTTKITPEKIAERVQKKYINTPIGAYVAPKKNKRDVVVVGGGHNGLISSAYLAKAGLDVLVLERRHCVGGAAVTEEMVPGFHFSRASYLAGLLRPRIIKDLNLEKYGFQYLPRNPSSFTPTKLDDPLYHGKYLLLGSNDEMNYQSISQFSKKDADSYIQYELFLNQIREIMQPILDAPPVNLLEGNWKNTFSNMKTIEEMIRAGVKNSNVLLPFYEFFMAPAQQILDRYFESDILKTTLATDAVIGASISPRHNGSAYVLLHHVMGEAAGQKGVWAYVKGGMGAISQAIASSARESGAEIVTNATVRKILHDGARVKGVQMDDGSVIETNTILSGTTPYHTFIELMPEWANGFSNPNSELAKFTHHLRHSDYSCGAFKINCAVDKLPNFSCFPSPADGTAGPMHRGTVHFESRMDEIEFAYREAAIGMPATRPVIEMTIPTSLDNTLAPKGKHVVQFFVQYAPYEINPKVGSWADPAFKEEFVQRCFKIVDEFCPGFSSSVIGYDALSPLDLERVFGLHKGSISHGAFSLHQIAYGRPMPGYSSHRTPVKGLYLCSAGTHPGGGVMGAAGRNCAQIVLSDIR